MKIFETYISKEGGYTNVLSVDEPVTIHNISHAADGGLVILTEKDDEFGNTSKKKIILEA